ncbi:MAG: AmmeMemoRadiSam system protein B [Melioribacteraceae bacterium]|nr:AmmeMemoRadiSam system protein B [Melioribacteraceae bacterium]
MTTVRHAAVAGMFYPENPEVLSETVDLMLDETKCTEQFKNIFGIVAPHAGYMYSGKTAACAYNLLKGKEINRVVIISPSHREYFKGISIFEGDAYETPLGEVFIDDGFRTELTKNSEVIMVNNHGHHGEHALEVHIPFLQRVLKDFTIVPIVMGDQRQQFIDELAKKLALLMDKKTIVVASSDLSHFYNKKNADHIDSKIEKRIANFDFEGLQRDLENKTCEACGGGAIVALMKAATIAGYNNSKVLNRSDSGDVSGDNSEVVGYLSAVIYG